LVGVITPELLHLAGRQHGVFRVDQAVEQLGLSAAAIARARRRGLLVEVVPKVVRIASAAESFEQRCMAMHLRFDGTGFLSGWTAARLHRLRKMPAQPIHLTLPTGRGKHLPRWVEVHRSRWFDLDVDSCRGPDGMTVATPLRTLFGLAASFNQFRFERAAEDAWHLGLVTPHEAAIYLESNRCRGKDGVMTMERWLDRSLHREQPAQSDLERTLLEELDRLGLPEPVRQHPVTLPTGETIHLDIAWPELLLAVEPGDAWWHGGDLGQRRDQARDRACNELGWLVVRFDETMRLDMRAAAQQVARIVRRRRLELRNPS
jgi:very-short-patch-repair endonuclease